MYHDFTDLLMKSFRFPHYFAPWKASHRFKISVVQYCGGLGNSAPGISLSFNLSTCSAHAMRPLKQSHNAIELFADTAAILNSIISNSYYGVPRGQIHINLFPEASRNVFRNNRNQNDRINCRKVC